MAVRPAHLVAGTVVDLGTVVDAAVVDTMVDETTVVRASLEPGADVEPPTAVFVTGVEVAAPVPPSRVRTMMPNTRASVPNTPKKKIGRSRRILHPGVLWGTPHTTQERWWRQPVVAGPVLRKAPWIPAMPSSPPECLFDWGATVVGRGAPACGDRRRGGPVPGEHLYGVEIHFRDLGQVFDHRRYPQQRVAQRRDVTGIATAVPVEQFGGLYLADHLGGIDVGERVEPERDVTEQLDEDAAEAEREERPKQGILGHPDEYLVSAADEFLNERSRGIGCDGHDSIVGSGDGITPRTSSARPPTSVLWRMLGATTFRTTGSPSSAAATTASSRLLTTRDEALRMP